MASVRNILGPVGNPKFEMRNLKQIQSPTRKSETDGSSFGFPGSNLVFVSCFAFRISDFSILESQTSIRPPAIRQPRDRHRAAKPRAVVAVVHMFGQHFHRGIHQRPQAIRRVAPELTMQSLKLPANSGFSRQNKGVRYTYYAAKLPAFFRPLQQVLCPFRQVIESVPDPLFPFLWRSSRS